MICTDNKRGQCVIGKVFIIDYKRLRFQADNEA